MGGKRRTIRRGNIIAERLDARLQELGWGSLSELLARLHLMSGQPGYAELAEIPQETLSRIRHGRRPAFDYELFAIAQALKVDVYWLAGLTDQKEPRADVRLLWPDNDREKE